MTAEEICALLKLEPHATCGFVRVTFISEKWIAAGGLPPPFAEGRPAGSALYFMVTPDAPLRLHRICNDQLYRCYLDYPIDVLMLRADGTSERAIVGADLRSGQRVQLSYSRQYFSYGAHNPRRLSGLVSGGKPRMAGRGASRRGNWRCRFIGRKASGRGRRCARISTR